MPNTGHWCCRLLKVEMEDRAHWLDQKQSDAVAALIESHGFVPVLCDLEYLGQFNTIYVHKQRLEQCAGWIARAQKRQRILAATDLCA
jgi:prephenate dehydratase